MMNARQSAIWCSVLVVLLAAGFYFSSQKSIIYQNVVDTLEQFRQSSIDTAAQVQWNIFAPAPLTVKGSENATLLTKEKIIANTNIQRYDNGGLPALTENSMLDAAALAKANDMFSRQYFEHVSPVGVDPGQLVKSAGYDYIVTGENLILGTFKNEEAVVQAWMNSPGHRANIVNNRYVDMGAAIVRGKFHGETVWIAVQEFGLPLSACQQANGALKTQIDENKNTLDNLTAQIEAKKAQISSSDKNSSHYNQLVDEYNALVNQYNPLNDQTKQLIAQYNYQIDVFNQCVKGM